MQDKPDAPMLLAEVQTELKTGIAPGFQQAVAANAIALALREQDKAAAGHAAEHARLVELLGHDGSLDALNRLLATRIREGAMDRTDSTLTRHLILTTIEKMIVDQPRYPAFRACRATHGEQV